LLANAALELDRGGRQAAVSHQIGIEDRQRVVGEGNASDVGLGERELLGGERGKPGVVRAVARRR